MARRKRFPVVVTKLSDTTRTNTGIAAGAPPAKRMWSPEIAAAYSAFGIEEVEARRLFSFQVLPDEFDEWSRLIKLVNVDHVIKMKRAHLTPALYKEYPSWTLVTERMDFAFKSITPETVRAYENAFLEFYDSEATLKYHHRTIATAIPEAIRTNCPPRAISDYAKRWKQSAGIPLPAGTLRPPAPNLLLSAVRVDCPRLVVENNPLYIVPLLKEWRLWVEAAKGHRAVAAAVCNAGGAFDSVTDWLNTGETPERIAFLVKAGNSPTIVDDPQLGELTDDDLAVWAALTSGTLAGAKL